MTTRNAPRPFPSLLAVRCCCFLGRSALGAGLGAALTVTSPGAALVAASFTVSACSLQPEWRRFDSAEGRFEVEFPRPVRESVETAKSETGDIPLHFATSQLGMSTYAVLWVDYPEDRVGDAQATLDAAVVGAVKNVTAGKLVHSEPVKGAPHPTQHFLARFGGDMWLEGRIVLVGRRVLQVTVSYRDKDPDARAPDRERFLASFKAR